MLLPLYLQAQQMKKISKKSWKIKLPALVGTADWELLRIAFENKFVENPGPVPTGLVVIQKSGRARTYRRRFL